MSKKFKKELEICIFSGLGTCLLVIGLGLGSYWLYVWGDLNFDGFAMRDLRTLIFSISGLLIGSPLLFKSYKLYKLLRRQNG